jgi:excisionase family DNA binding protein
VVFRQALMPPEGKTMSSTATILLTPAELAASLRVSERTVARMVAEGCPSLLIGSRRRFELMAVAAWTQAREKEKCQSDKTPMAAGMPKRASAVNAFTAASRKVQLRVMPSASKQS